MGGRKRRIAYLLSLLLAFGRMDVEMEAVLKRTRTTKHPWLTACDANMSPKDFEKKNLVSKRSNACDCTRRSVNVQIKKCQRRMGGKGI